jgi:hypothetical protein
VTSVKGFAAAAALLATLGCGGSTARSPVATFVVVGNDGTLLTSGDGEAWVEQSGGITANLSSVATGRGLFVAVGAGGRIVTSPDGVTWSERRRAPVDLLHVIYTGEEFIAVGGDWDSTATTFRSVDGATWTELESPSEYSFQAVAATRSTVVVAAVKPSKTTPMALDNVVLASVPRTTTNRGGWVERDVPRFSDSLSIDAEAVTVGSWAAESTLCRTQDGESWSEEELPIDAAKSVATDGERLVVVGASSSTSSDDDGSWSDPVELEGKLLNAVGFGAGLFIAVGARGVILTSRHGADWTARESRIEADLSDVAFGPEP